MEDYDDYLEDIPTVDCQEFKDEHLELLQRPKRALVNTRWSEEHSDFYNIHSLFMSGYIDRDRYMLALREEEQDINPVTLYQVINNKHTRKIEAETVVHLRVNRDEFNELLNNKLKNNHFTILLFISLRNEMETEMSCLVLKNQGEIQVIQYGDESPFVTSLDEFFLINEVLQDEMYLFAIEGRYEGKKRLQKSVLQVVAQQPFSMPHISKKIFSYVNPHREYSPKRKSPKPIRKRTVKRKSPKPIRKRTVKRKSPKPIRKRTVKRKSKNM